MHTRANFVLICDRSGLENFFIIPLDALFDTCMTLIVSKLITFFALAIAREIAVIDGTAVSMISILEFFFSDICQFQILGQN